MWFLWIADITIPSGVPDFFVWSDILLIFSSVKLEVHHISISSLFDLLTKKVCYTLHHHVDNFHQIWSWYDHLLPSYSILAAETLRDLDILTLKSNHAPLILHAPLIRLRRMALYKCVFDLIWLTIHGGPRDESLHQVWIFCLSVLKLQVMMCPIEPYHVTYV